MSINFAAEPTCPEAIAAGQDKADDDYDDMTVAELDAVIDEWEYDISKSLNKAEKIAAMRAADAED